MLSVPDLSGSERRALENVVVIVKRRWPLAEIMVFGSKARGTADEESDLDLLVLLPCPVTDEIRTKIIHEIFSINLTYDSNISVLLISKEEWNSVPLSLLPFHESVEKEGIAL